MKWKDRKNVYRTIIIRGLYREERKEGRCMKWKDRKNVYRIIIIRGLYKEERKRRKEGTKEGRKVYEMKG